MKPENTKTPWFFIQLHCLLFGSLVDSSSLASGAQTSAVVSQVGNQAVLPCSWKSRVGGVQRSDCHIQWKTPMDTVFELRGADTWEADEFKGRVEVPEDGLRSGDCSLIIRDVQIKDTGRYESFMVVDGVRATKTRVFIQSVKLSVFDHKSLESRGPGEDLVLDLHTPHSVRVVFQGRNSSEWSVVWMKGDRNDPRLHEDLQKQQLTIRDLRRSDDGTYKVLDELGLAVSTVQLSVEGKSTSQRVHQIQESPVPTDEAAKSSSSALLISSLLFVTSFQILHFF